MNKEKVHTHKQRRELESKLTNNPQLVALLQMYIKEAEGYLIKHPVSPLEAQGSLKEPGSKVRSNAYARGVLNTYRQFLHLIKTQGESK